MKPERSRDPSTHGMRWTARIWSIPLIAYSLIMAVGTTWSWVTTGTADPYAVDPVSQLEALPPILLGLSTMGLAIAWWHERVGAVITLIISTAVLVLLQFQHPLARIDFHTLTPYLMVLAVFVPAILFLVCSLRGSRT